MAVKAVLTGSAAVASLGVVEAQVASTPAPASTETPPQEIVVTGSRLVIPNQVSISPVTTVTSDVIQQTGVTRVEDLLNELPQVYAAQSSTVVNGSDGTAQLNLRNLGAKRTLILVDGQRLGPGDPRSGGASDVNMIPTALIDSVEVLTGGASSTYGADAVAGVVNFKLNDHYEGVKLVATGSFYNHNNTDIDGVIQALHDYNTVTGNHFAQAPSSVTDGTTESLSFVAGVNSGDGKGNATFYATYRHIAPVIQSNYSVSACTLAGGFATSSGYGTTPGAYSCAGSSTSYPGRFLFAGASKTLGANNTLIPYTKAYAFNYGPLNYFSRPDENYSAGAFLHYDFNEHVSVYASSMFMDDLTNAQIAPSGAFFGHQYTLGCNNPYFTSAELTTWCGGLTTGTTKLIIGRRNVEGGNRDDNLEHTDFREVIGVKGKIDNNWTYDVSGQNSQVNLEETYYNDVSVTKIGYALNAVAGPNGPQCAVTAAGNTAGLAAGCVPWDIFQLGGVTPAATGYLNTPGVQRGQVKQYIVNANFSGDLGAYGLKLPTASYGVLVNFGGEYRDVHDYTITDVEFQTGDLSGQGGPILPVEGNVTSREAFIETHVPIMDDHPFAKNLAIDGGFRYSKYAASFETSTYKLGVEWQPTADYRIRGSFTRAVRAPNISELFSVDSVGLVNSTDLCVTGTKIVSQATCAAQGVPAAQYGNAGGILISPAGQYNDLSGGNRQLQPETAITSSFGIGWTPSFVPNLRVNLDYYDIKISGIVAGLGFRTIQTLCGTEGAYCNLIHRDPNYATLWLEGGYITDLLQNVGRLEQKGIDVDVGYSYNLGGLGKLSASLVGTYVNKYEITPILVDQTSAYNCEGYYGFTCGSPTFKWRHTMRLNWATPWDGIGFGVAWRYFSPVQSDTLNPNPNTTAGPNAIALGNVPLNGIRIPDYSYIDLTASWKVNENVSLRLGVNNVADKNPPVIGVNSGGSNGNTYPEFYDALGRYFFATATVQF
jgi:outer membrane receptor protein involved in Fe transport